MSISVGRVIDILIFVSNQKHGTTLSNIARELDIPKSTVFNIVHTLVDKDMLQVCDQTRMIFNIGYRAFELGLAYIGQNSLWDIVHKELDSLVSALQMTGSYFINDGDTLTLMDILPYSGSAYPNFSVGTRWAFPTFPAGMVCLAACKDDELVSRFKDDVSDLSELLEQVRQARSDGYYIGSTSDQLISISVPVYDFNQICVGVISLYDLSSRLEQARIKTIICLARDYADKISKQLGWLSGGHV